MDLVTFTEEILNGKLHLLCCELLAIPIEPSKDTCKGIHLNYVHLNCMIYLSYGNYNCVDV